METKLNVKGMHCKSCEMLITDALMDLEGVKKAKANHKSGSVEVVFDDSKIKKEDIVSVINKEGYRVINYD